MSFCLNPQENLEFYQLMFFFYQVGGAYPVLLPFTDVYVSQGVTQCLASPCQPNPCHSGATCWLKNDVAVNCLCPLGFTGAFCQEGQLVESKLMEFAWY